MKQNDRIIIIGGGLSGLTLAYLLSKEHIFTTILEASSRLGGRIQTLKGENETPLELGATWFSDIHPNLISLLEDLGLKKFPQYAKGKSLFQTKSFEPPQVFYIPEAETPSYRIVGGTQNLINTLSGKLKPEQIKLNTKVISIKEVNNELIVESNKGEKYIADKVVLCLPPQLVSSQIEFSPALPDDISSNFTDSTNLDGRSYKICFGIFQTILESKWIFWHVIQSCRNSFRNVRPYKF